MNNRKTEDQKNIFVSIVIPTYNRADLVTRAVASALNQTHGQIEVIVVSDGSDDDTDNVMQKLCEQDNRVKYISYHPAKGGNVARNIGIENAQYEFVAFLDDDDEWHKDKIEKQLNIFYDNCDIGLVCTGINAIYVGEGTSTIFIPTALLDSSKEILIRNCIGSTTTVMVKKDLFEQCGIFDPELKALQDYDLWIRLCQKTKVGVVKEPCVEYYNYKSNNQISQYTERYIEAVRYIDSKYENLLSVLSAKERGARNNVFMLLISKKGMRNGQMKIAIKYALKALEFRITKQAVVCLIASFVPYRVLRKLKS